MADLEAVTTEVEKITSTVDMELVEETAAIVEYNGNSKRAREDEGAETDENGGGVAKKLKEEKSIEEERMEKLVGGEEKKDEASPISLGPKNFGSSVEMFDFFFKLLHSWTVNIDINKYEYLLLLDLLKKGHLEPEKKIGNGVRAFQVRFHPEYKSRCFFIVKDNGSADDFSFRKCVDHISPLPDNLKVKSEVSRGFGGRFGGGGGGRGGRFGRGGGGRGRR
ncbi:protein EMBRYO DEFECTIVE 514-like [Impatiens glandulifera]|uniref:protein EMBRYO DEFECTIVE 514-like n=1 Tax=Impatiens glandulifera TaxID=253017 RepID=UPI001FB078EC|nr:protein EMBRYO DEFECTIVE 514-like [Impatiens glandulifera]